jgi:multidrug efflux pump subunit AcrB
MATKVRAILAEYHNATYNVRLPSVLGGEIYFPISAIIRGPDLNQLAEISKKVADRMHQYPLDLAAAHTISSIKEVGLPAGYSYLFSGQVKVLEETTWNLLLAMLLASVFMYMVLAAQFESFAYPFIIMLTLPLSVPFALLSLWITGHALSLWSALGMFLLLGIVKKNRILQVDYTNRLVADGMPYAKPSWKRIGCACAQS